MCVSGCVRVTAQWLVAALSTFLLLTSKLSFHHKLCEKGNYIFKNLVNFILFYFFGNFYSWFITLCCQEQAVARPLWRMSVSLLLNTCFSAWAVSYSPLMCRPGGDCGFSLWFSGLWKCQDCTQQQFQSLWEVHPGQLPGEWHRAGVRKTKSHKNNNQFICGFFWNLNLCFNSHVFKTPVLLYKSRSHESTQIF